MSISAGKKNLLYASCISCLALVLPLNILAADHHHHPAEHQHHHHECDSLKRSEKGERGERGERGKKGNKGEIGNTGLTGLTGLTGSRGLQGLQGIQGLVGDIGPTGPAGSFLRDLGQTVEVNFALSVTIGDTLGATITPYVVAPDGEIIKGFIQPAVVGLNSIPSITLVDPVFGSYKAGIQIDSGITALGANLVESFIASRDLENPKSITVFYNNTVTIGLANSLSQTQGSFTYGLQQPLN